VLTQEVLVVKPTKGTSYQGTPHRSDWDAWNVRRRKCWRKCQRKQAIHHYKANRRYWANQEKQVDLDRKRRQSGW
jgi:hypothetical protein